MESRLIQGNTYVLDLGILDLPYYKINETDIILLDTGYMKDHREKLAEFFTANRLQVKGILCSHAHIDHVGNAQFFKEKYGAIVAMAQEEANIVHSTLGLKIFYSTYPLSKVEEHYGHMVVQTDLPISSQETSVTLCGVTFELLHTPGHSIGHMVITTPDKVSYLGDALISEDVMASAKMPYAYLLKEDLASKVSLYTLKSDWYVLAHKGVYPDIRDLITDNIYFYRQRAEEVLRLVTEKMTQEDILKAAAKTMGFRVGSINKYLVVERMLRSYLDYLVETGKLILTLDAGFLKYINPNERNMED